ITLSMARMIQRQEDRFKALQMVVLMMAKDGMTSGWKPIIKVYVSNNPKQLKPEHRDYIFVAFNYVPGHDLRKIVKISNKVKTSHFREMISLN
ncbi:unnamed protein product, partial [marine sediment metagenome]